MGQIEQGEGLSIFCILPVQDPRERAVAAQVVSQVFLDSSARYGLFYIHLVWQRESDTRVWTRRREDGGE